MEETILKQAVRTGTTAEGDRIVATAELSKLGNQRPSFSVTSTIYRGVRRVGGAANEEEIARIFPEWALLTHLHLSTDDGVPMHAEANGWYWYTKATRGEATDAYHPDRPALHALANHLRISHGEAHELVEEELSREAFAAYVASQVPRWNEEAKRAIAILDAEANSTTPPTPIQAWIDENKIGFSAERDPAVRGRVGDWKNDPESSHWLCTFNRQAGPRTKTYKVDFHMGSAHEGRPVAADVLESLLEEAQTYQACLADDSERRELGLTAAHMTLLKRNTEGLIKFLGEEDFATLTA